MKLMLDTNICIAIIKQKPKDILQKFSAYQVGDICISSVTLAELRYGVAKSQYQEKNQAALDEFILPLEVVDWRIKYYVIGAFLFLALIILFTKSDKIPIKILTKKTK